MPSYQAPTKDMEFVLHDVLKISESQTPGYEDLDRDITGAILGEAGRIASEVLAPLNAIGDTEINKACFLAPGNDFNRMSQG